MRAYIRKDRVCVQRFKGHLEAVQNKLLVPPFVENAGSNTLQLEEHQLYANGKSYFNQPEGSRVSKLIQVAIAAIESHAINSLGKERTERIGAKSLKIIYFFFVNNNFKAHIFGESNRYTVILPCLMPSFHATPLYNCHLETSANTFSPYFHFHDRIATFGQSFCFLLFYLNTIFVYLDTLLYSYMCIHMYIW